jgi:hypothetical protein
MSDSFFGDVGEAISNIGSGISDFLTGGVGTDPNRLISRFRSQGIPDGAERSRNGSSISARFSDAAKGKDWRVRISNDSIYYGNNAMKPLTGTGGLIFPYLPTITMSHTANYETITTSHTNYPFYAYKSSQVDDITITGQFTVQSQEEATYWLAAIHFLRTVTKMYFGQGANLGNPPPICKLDGYGDFVYNNVSVVVKSFSVNLDKEVDYIAAQVDANIGQVKGTNVSYVPTISTITVVVAPVYSREKIKSFDLGAFSRGELVVGKDGKGLGFI